MVGPVHNRYVVLARSSLVVLLHRQSGFLGLDEFVSSENAIPGAKLGEYAEVRSSDMLLNMVKADSSTASPSVVFQGRAGRCR